MWQFVLHWAVKVALYAAHHPDEVFAEVRAAVALAKKVETS